jgi:hypothetical protein
MGEQRSPKQTGAVAVSGRAFFSWATLGSFAGTATAVNIIWMTLQSLDIAWASSKLVPLIASLCIMAVYGVFSEPDELTTWWQKGQKVIQGIVNGLLVYSAVVGISVIAT